MTRAPRSQRTPEVFGVETLELALLRSVHDCVRLGLAPHLDAEVLGRVLVAYCRQHGLAVRIDCDQRVGMGVREEGA